MVTEMQPGTFPVLDRGNNQAMFVQHSQAVPQHVVLPDGVRKMTGYVGVSNASIDLYALCQNSGQFRELVIEEIAYIDAGDNLKKFVMTKMAPTVLDKKDIRVGFVTKLCDLRWGFNLTMDTKTGKATIAVDAESPIVGVKLRFQ